jgi:hypothetical protein
MLKTEIPTTLILKRKNHLFQKIELYSAKWVKESKRYNNLDPQTN